MLRRMLYGAVTLTAQYLELAEFAVLGYVGISVLLLRHEVCEKISTFPGGVWDLRLKL